jgi:hypothetical protein
MPSKPNKYYYNEKFVLEVFTVKYQQRIGGTVKFWV